MHAWGSLLEEGDQTWSGAIMARISLEPNALSKSCSTFCNNRPPMKWCPIFAVLKESLGTSFTNVLPILGDSGSLILKTHLRRIIGNTKLNYEPFFSK